MKTERSQVSQLFGLNQKPVLTIQLVAWARPGAQKERVRILLSAMNKWRYANGRQWPTLVDNPEYTTVNAEDFIDLMIRRDGFFHSAFMRNEDMKEDGDSSDTSDSSDTNPEW